jgi:hypothetical protein
MMPVFLVSGFLLLRWGKSSGNILPMLFALGVFGAGMYHSVSVLLREIGVLK